MPEMTAAVALHSDVCSLTACWPDNAGRQSEGASGTLLPPRPPGPREQRGTLAHAASHARAPPCKMTDE